MDMKQLLPFFLKGKLGEREQALLKLTETRDPAALTSLITEMYEHKPQQRRDVFATFKKIVPSELLGKIIKYYDTEQMRD